MSRPLPFAVLLLGLIPAGPTVPARPVQEASLKAAVDSFLDPRIAADAFSGVVLIASKGTTVYQRAAGVADREAGTPITLTTRLELASVTKLFTRIAILQLAQAGQVSLADTVGKFLPQYPNPVVRRKVTVDQLLRHRSGVGSFWNERFMARRAEVRSVGDYLELFQDDSLLFEPGTSEAYSNGGYVLLGAIIERASGMSYHDYLEDRIFRPAGMTRTVPYDRRAKPKDAAIGYTTQPLAGPMTGDRRLPGPPGPRAGATSLAGGTARRPNIAIQPGRSGPAGGHYSTAGDFLKLASALAEHRLLDSTHTTALYGARYARGDDFRANGGGPGVNAELSIFPSGQVMVVLSNYDPPAATEVALYIRSLLGRFVAGGPRQ
jgi:CubicO group peptidase (beta-lactamase class C family)